MKFATKTILVIAMCVAGLFAGSIPSGMELIFKNVEPGQPFHPFWPPISGKNVLGTVVIAKKATKPQAFFQTIDSPSYRNPSFSKQFIVGELPLDAPDLTTEKQIGVGVAFSQLDSIGKALSTGSSSQSLQGSSGSSSLSCVPSQQASDNKTQGQKATTSSTSSNTPTSKTVGGGQQTAGGATASAPSGQSTSSNTSASPQKVTGFDFCRFSNASSKMSSLRIVYYDLPTLDDLSGGEALLPSAQQRIAKGSNGWIIHRALVVDSLEYTLTANTDLDAGFFAKLVSWLPTVSVSYKTSRTVTLKTTSPLTIGYKLWQRGLGVEGRDILTKDDLPKLGLGAEQIDELLTRK